MLTIVAASARPRGEPRARSGSLRRSCCCGCASPAVAYWVSLPASESAAADLSSDDVRALRLTARRTWLFFETFVAPEDHALPPDNFQDDPHPVVEHRTSPTNIGMYLLATVTARDFGWIGTIEMVERLEETMSTIGKLEHFRGHLYNWYDTRDLRRLEPAYVSSVDSGNLAGHLLTLSNACRQMIDQPLPVEPPSRGSCDAVELTRAAAADAIGDDRRSQTLTRRHLDEALEWPEAEGPMTPTTWTAHLGRAPRVVPNSVRHRCGTHRRTRRGPRQRARRPGQKRRARSSTAICGIWSSASLNRSPSRCSRRLAELSDPIYGPAKSGSDAAATLVRRLQTIAEQADRLLPGDGLRLPLRSDSQAVLHRVPRARRRARPELLRPARLRGSARQLPRRSPRATSPPDHWFRLGRALTPVGRGSALISWSGSMFEFLMPALVMRAPANSLLEQTNRFVVARQIQYAAGTRCAVGHLRVRVQRP